MVTEKGGRRRGRRRGRGRWKCDVLSEFYSQDKKEDKNRLDKSRTTNSSTRSVELVSLAPPSGQIDDVAPWARLMT